MAEFALNYGRQKIQFSLADENVLDVIEGKNVAAVQNVKKAVVEVLRNPIGTKPLAQIVNKGDKVAIVVSDITRAWIKYDVYLPYLIEELNLAGVRDEDILLVVSLGAHRLHTDEENCMIYGKEVVARVKLVQSHAQNHEDFVYVGTTSRGIKTYQNKHVVQADKVILTGGIIYHSMAGFGGGRKAVLPGISGYSTIQGNHRFCLHEEEGKGINPYCDNGLIDGNPMHEDMQEMAQMLDADFLFNVIPTVDGHFAGFVAGHWDLAWKAGCEMVKDIFGVPITQKADLVIASAGGFPKDINFYQASKAQDNAVLACKDDGVVILLLACPDIAEPPDFSGWFAYGLYEREMILRKEFTVPGFVALKCGLTARRLPHIVVTLPQNKEFIEKAGMIYAANISEAMKKAEEILGKTNFKASILPHGGTTVPILQQDISK